VRWCPTGSRELQGEHPRAKTDGRTAADLDAALVPAAPSLTCKRAVQITRFGGPEVLDVVDLPDPVPGDGEQFYDVSAAGVNFADTHYLLSHN
jgi:hypothetical protein